MAVSDPQFALAEVSSLAEWLGESIDGDEVSRASWALAAATSLVLDHTGQSPTSWATADVPPPVVHVVLACAARGFSNPEGWAYESVDDWRAGGRKVDEAGFFLTDQEKRTLNAYAAAPGARGIGIMRVERPARGPWPPLDGVASVVLGVPQ